MYKILPVVVFSILITAILITPSALAHDGPDPEPVIQHTLDTVLGFTPIEMVIIITAVGIGGRTLMSVGKKLKTFSFTIMVQSIFVGALSAFALVSAAVENLPIGISDLALFEILIGQIVIVAGVDKGIRDVQKAMTPAIQNRVPVYAPAPTHTHNTNPHVAPQESTFDSQVAQELAEMQSIIDEEESEDLPPGKGGA